MFLFRKNVICTERNVSGSFNERYATMSSNYAVMLIEAFLIYKL